MRETTRATGVMDLATKEILRTAADQARCRFPGPVGELLRQELLSWMVFGHQLGTNLIMRVAEHVLDEAR